MTTDEKHYLKMVAALAKQMRKSFVMEVTDEKTGVSMKLHPVAFAPKATIYDTKPKTPEQAKKEAEDDLFFSATPTRKK